MLVRDLGRGSAVITGASSGLGRAIAARLARAGWRLALVDLPRHASAGTMAAGTMSAGDAAAGPQSPDQPESPEDIVSLARAHGGDGILVPFDVRDGAGWQRLHDRLRAEWPSLELLVNCAGVGATGEVGRLPEEQWRRVVDTNLIGTALGCETFLPWLRSHPRRSHLVNVASIAGILAPPSMAAYSASKAGVIALSEAIAAECDRGRPGVTVVCPGFFRSGLLGSWHFSSRVESREAVRRMDVAWWSSDRVARRVLAGVRRNRRYVVVGLQARWLWRLKRLAPRLTTALVRGIYRRLGR